MDSLSGPQVPFQVSKQYLKKQQKKTLFLIIHETKVEVATSSTLTAVNHSKDGTYCII